MGDAEDLSGLARILTCLDLDYTKLKDHLGDVSAEAKKEFGKKHTKSSAGAAIGKTYRGLWDGHETLASLRVRGCQAFNSVTGMKVGNVDYDNELRNIRGIISMMKPVTDLFSNDVAQSVGGIFTTRAGEYAFKRWKGELDPREEDEPLSYCRACGGLREDEWQGSRADIDTEFVGPGEKSVARNLRMWCTSYGEEIDQNFKQTANALVRLGMIYVHKAACETRGMLQKLSFLRCAALLHAARIRIERVNGVADLLNTTLFNMNKELLKVVDDKQTQSDELQAASLDVARMLAASRGTMESDLKTFENSKPYHTASSEQIQNEILSEDRINKIKKMNEETTDNYISLMQNITMKCLAFLGGPPLRFTIVGLGSMARKEITLYSDFEHIILLEEGCHSGEILEYFRWFTVLFQIIIIGLGETIVPTVSVRSINDLYSEKGDGNCWFYDVITTCGIAFDGMAPHSCATPLGRQMATKDSPQRTELIKPVSEMLAYVLPSAKSRYQQDLKHLLSTTCFVFGDEELYLCFREGVTRILQDERPEDVCRQNVERITRNRSREIREGSHEVERMVRLSAKASYYRPFTVMIECLGRIHKVEAIGTFDILKALKSKEAINNELYHKLSFAFAVTCEMRMRAYAKARAQRRVLYLDDLRRMVGEKAEWMCKDMLQYLQDSMRKHEKATLSDSAMADLRKFNDEFVSDSPQNQVRNWYFCGEYRKAAEVARQYASACHDWKEEESNILQYWLFKSCYQAGKAEGRELYWAELENLYDELTRSPLIMKREKAECYCLMAEVYELQHRYREAYNVTKKWLLFYLEEGKTEHHVRDNDFPDLYREHLIAAHGEIQPEGSEEISCFLEKLLSKGFVESRSTLRCLRYVIQGAANETPEDLSWLADLAENIQQNSREIEEPRKLLKVIWAFQVNNQRWADALRTADLLKEFPDIPCTDEDHRATNNQEWSNLSFTCAAAEIIHAVNEGYEIFKTLPERASAQTKNVNTSDGK